MNSILKFEEQPKPTILTVQTMIDILSTKDPNTRCIISEDGYAVFISEIVSSKLKKENIQSRSVGQYHTDSYEKKDNKEEIEVLLFR